MIIARVIPEPHIQDTQMETRVDYLMEIQSYMLRILEQFKELHATLGPNDRLIAIFVGDVFNRSMTQLAPSLQWIQYLVTLRSYAEIYSVVGNHEITYRSNNLFWMLSDCQSEFVSSRRLLTEDIVPLMPLIKVVDELQVGPILFVFGHYRFDVSYITDEYIDQKYKGIQQVILLSHNEILTPQIADHSAKVDGRDLLFTRQPFNTFETANLIPLTARLKQIYIGHMHKAYGHFRWYGDLPCGIHVDFRLTYLASLGRTNVTEVQNNFCMRMIPQLMVGDQGDISQMEEPFELATEDVVVDEEVVLAHREDYHSMAELRALKSPELTIANPVADIQQILRNDPTMNIIFRGLLEKRMPTAIDRLLEASRNLIGG